MTLFCANAMAQTSDEIILKKWSSGIEQVQFLVEKHSKQTTTIMPNTEEKWIKGSYFLENPPIVDWDSLFPGKWNVMTIMKKQLCINMQCMLTNRSNETVLHCYLPLSADVVTNIWLASEETAIVDMETGIQYRARRTFPDSCMRKHITVKAHNPIITNEKALGHCGDVADFQIIFPKLPETTKTIAIYGVPMWHLRGEQIQLDNRRITKDLSNPYDDAPQFKKARLVKEEKDYNKNDSETWPIYTDVHLIKPVNKSSFALWRTKDATYLAIAEKQNKMQEYYNFSDDNPQERHLSDKIGGYYKLLKVIGFPTDKIFGVNGYSGDFFAYVMVFEPLPDYVSVVSYYIDNKLEVIPNLNVNELRANQPLFEYHQRIIKE